MEEDPQDRGRDEQELLCIVPLWNLSLGWVPTTPCTMSWRSASEQTDRIRLSPVRNPYTEPEVLMPNVPQPPVTERHHPTCGSGKTPVQGH